MEDSQDVLPASEEKLDNSLGPQPQANANENQAFNSCQTSACERCKQTVKPLRDTLPDVKTHLIAGLFFILGFPFLCFVPYCFDWFGKPVNRCPQCGAFMKM